MDVLSKMAESGIVPVVVLEKVEDAVPTAKVDRSAAEDPLAKGERDLLIEDTVKFDLVLSYVEEPDLRIKRRIGKYVSRERYRQAQYAFPARPEYISVIFFELFHFRLRRFFYLRREFFPVQNPC